MIDTIIGHTTDNVVPKLEKFKLSFIFYFKIKYKYLYKIIVKNFDY